MKKCIIIVLSLLCYSLSIFALPSKSNYPHWDFTNKVMYQKLVKIDKFIKANKNKGYVAVFDWDGTLYSQQIPLLQYRKGQTVAGQMAWYIWASYHLYDPKYSGLFPNYQTADGKGGCYFRKISTQLVQQLKKSSGIYGAYRGIATLGAGMVQTSMAKGVNGYLQMYPAKKYILYPVMDLMQHLIDSGFNVWIVTGDTPYYLSALLKNIEHNINYTPVRKYNFNLSAVPYNPETGHLIGNGPRLSKHGVLTAVYDNSYTSVPNSNKLYVVNGQGKLIVINNYINKRVKKPFVFYAGNSGGDYQAIQALVTKRGGNVLAVAVNPIGSLRKLVKKYPHKIVVIKT